jgi:hypothetical protein
MKKSILRLLGVTLLLAILIGIITACLGWLLGWKTGTQFSNGLFLLGGIAIILGIFSVLGGFGMRSDFHVVYSQSAGAMSTLERTQRWMADMTQGYSFYIFLLLTGAFLIGLSILVGMVIKV